MQSTQLAQGGLLAGRYQLVRELGRGATGRVVLAIDTAADDMLCALKLVAPAYAATARWELQLLRQVAHPNLARVLELVHVAWSAPEADAHAGAAALVTEYAPGRSAAVLARERARQPDQLTALALQVACSTASALAAVHAHGFLHGDVKPDNLVVADDGSRCTLVDFGLAAPLADTQPIALSGTLGFMAPELWRGERSAASDAYALGATLVALLRGAPPVEASVSASDALRTAMLPFTERTPLPPWVAPALSGLIRELLEPVPSRRASHMRDIAARIAAIAATLGIALHVPEGDASTLGIASAAPSSSERIARLASLPWVGSAARIEELTAALETGGVCVVLGPHGAGRSRAVREAVAAVQSARVLRGDAAPTYLRVGSLPAAPVRARAIVHVAEGDGLAARELRAYLRACELEGWPATVVLERTEPLPVTVAQLAHASLEIAALREGELRKLLELAWPGEPLPQAWVREAMAASAGLAGRLCRLAIVAETSGAAILKPGAWRALAATQLEPAVAFAEPARAMAELLSIAGGELDAQCVERAWLARGEQGAAEAAHAVRDLLALGAASHVGEQLVLRADLVALVRDAMPAARRRALAVRFEALTLDARARAHVHAASGAPNAALEAFVRAVAAARALGHVERAAAIAEEGIGLVGADETLALAHADALRAAAEYARARRALDGASSPAAQVLRAEIARLHGDADRVALADQALAACGTDAEAREDAEALQARLALDAGDLARARTLATELATTGRSPRAVLRAAEIVACCALASGDRAAAAATLAPALQRAATLDLPAAHARLLALWAQLVRDDGGPYAAAQHLERAVALAEHAGERHATTSFVHNLGVQRLEHGQLGSAIEVLREACLRIARLGRDSELARALLNLALAEHLAGARDLALRAAEQAFEVARASQDAAAFAYAACWLAELRLERGERRAAINELAGLGEQLQREEALGEVAGVCVRARVAALHARLGDLGAADRELAAAQTRATSCGLDGPSVQLELALARCHVEREHGRGRQACVAADEALAAAERGAGFDARLRAALAASAAARAAGEGALAGIHLAQVRALLDEAAQSLPSDARAALREVPAYRAALEAAPAREPAAAARADERWRRLATLAKGFTSELRAPRLYERVLDAAVELSGAERGYLVLPDRDGAPRVRATRGLPRAGARAELEQDVASSRGGSVSEPLPSRSIVARVLATGRPLTSVDALRDERLTAAASVHKIALRSVLAVPVRLRDGLLGALYLEDRLRPFAFGEQEQALLVDLADLAAGAIDAARLVRAERRERRRVEVLRARLARRVDQHEAVERTASLASPSQMAGITTCAPRMQRVLALAEKVARAEVPVLLRGESGTGKEVLARAIHAASGRRDAPFVSESCGAIPEPLLESALFGHVRGAFTGADRRRQGLFELADGGTLLLDEIAEMSPAMQTRLLRVLQEGEVRPVGGERVQRVDVRVLAATHRDLEAMVEGGSFREDLFYRLSVVTLELPPLRERAEDVPLLVSALIDKHAAGRRIRIEPSALALLVGYLWPGNVRQLENELRRALALCDDRIGLEHLSPAVLGLGSAAPEPLDLRGQVDALERRLIRQALDTASGNQTRAARLLGVSRFGLQKMIRRLGAQDLDS